MKHLATSGRWAFALPALLLSLFLTGTTQAQALGTYESEHYRVHSDLTLEETRPLAEHMDATYEEFARRFRDLLGRGAGRDKLNLYLLSTNEAYLRFLAEQDINGTGSGGMFFGDGRGDNAVATFVYGRSLLDTKQVLQHEGFHQFANSYMGNGVPKWIDEGLATYFQSCVLINRRFRLGVAPPRMIEGIQQLVASGDTFELDGFINITPQQWAVNMADPTKQVAQYLQAWALTYFLIHGDGGRYQQALNQYLTRIASGQPSAHAFEAAFRTNEYAAMGRRWRGFIEDDLEADAFSVNLDRMFYMGTTAMLAKNDGDTLPSDLEAYIAFLQLHDFVLENAIGQVMSPNDAENFEYLDRRGRAVAIRYVLDAATGVPAISTPEAETPIRVVWSQLDGEQIYDLAFD